MLLDDNSRRNRFRICLVDQSKNLKKAKWDMFPLNDYFLLNYTSDEIDSLDGVLSPHEDFSYL